MSRIMTALLLIFILSGFTMCERKIEPEPLVRVPPVEAMVECKKIQPLDDDTMAGITDKLLSLIKDYKDCSSKHKSLKDFIDNK